MAHLLGRRKADAVSSRPAVHLGLCVRRLNRSSSAQNFSTKVQQVGNRGFLLFVSTAECQAGDVNVQARKFLPHGSNNPCAVPLRSTSSQGIFVQMVFQCHRVCDKFHTIIKTAVSF